MEIEIIKILDGNNKYDYEDVVVLIDDEYYFIPAIGINSIKNNDEVKQIIEGDIYPTIILHNGHWAGTRISKREAFTMIVQKE